MADQVRALIAKILEHSKHIICQCGKFERPWVVLRIAIPAGIEGASAKRGSECRHLPLPLVTVATDPVQKNQQFALAHHLGGKPRGSLNQHGSAVDHGVWEFNRSS